MDNSQITHSKTTFARAKKVKRSTRHDATHPTPKVDAVDILAPKERRMVDNIKDGGLQTTTSNITARRDTSHGQVRHTAAPASPITAPVSMHLPGAHVGGNAKLTNVRGDYVTNTVNNYGEKYDLKGLETFVSFGAQFDSSVQDPNRRCHPGTRQNVLKRLRDWVDNPKSAERIFWIYGPAGAGKSAIAQTIARSYTRSTVAATFFIFKSDISRNDGNKLFTTLAYQLAFSIPAARDYIARSLSERPDLPTTDIETQFKELLARPFLFLNENAAHQQLAPAIIDAVEKYKQLSPIIIIDGVDECIDEGLQRQFLQVIGDAVKDDRFPFRFLIASRPAKLDDANRDIEKYLVDNFSRIASEQGLDQEWPGREIIHEIVYKSSGNFIYASVVIRFVGDPYCFAPTQLDIVLSIQPPKTMSPFAILDQLFFEILGRVPDQVFLKRYLVLLVARISSMTYTDLYKDDAVLMHVSEPELHANLRRMRSLLAFEPIIDIHHRSFLDFLYDASRSSQYYTCEGSGIKTYLKVFVDSLVRYVSTVIERPDHRTIPHFAPEFRRLLKWYPLQIRLPDEAWEEVVQPVMDLQDKLLKLQDFTLNQGLLRCDKCTAFHLLRELTFVRLHQGFNSGATSVRRAPVKLKPSITSKTINDNDSILLSLFARLPETMEVWSPNKGVMNLMSRVLRLDYAETATKIHSMSDAQKLVDLLDYMIHAKNALLPDARRQAILLALNIFARVPIIPLSYFSNAHNNTVSYTWTHSPIDIEILSQTIFVNRILDRLYIFPLSRVKKEADTGIMFRGEGYRKFSVMYQKGRLVPSSATMIQITLQIVKTIQYFHSLGVVLSQQLAAGDLFLDPEMRPKLCCMCSTSRTLLDEKCQNLFSLEDNIFSFGCLLYELYCGPIVWPNYVVSSRREVVTDRPSEPRIPEYIWQLIQRCCEEDPKSRPTINEVVQEIEGWPSAGLMVRSSQNNVGHVEPSPGHSSAAPRLYSVLSCLGTNWCQ